VKARIKQYQYLLLHKPYGVLCQFTGGEGRKTLRDFGPFPPHVYPVGRLDADSEGLVLLTDDGHVKHILLEPRFHHPRTYLVQVERVPTDDALAKLRHGILIEGKQTLEAKVELLSAEPQVYPRPVPIRFRKNVSTSWLQLTIFEGRNRQVRKMTAAIGHPTLRLLRVAIGPLRLGALQPGEQRKLTPQEIIRLRTLADIPSHQRL